MHLFVPWRSDYRDSTFVNVTPSRATYIPTAFSPNGDNVNDVFTVYAKNESIVIESMQIFDRWGNLVFDGRDLPVNSTCCGWDGDFKVANNDTGKAMKSNHFVYLIRLRYADGTTREFSDGVQLVR